MAPGQAEWQTQTALKMRTAATSVLGDKDNPEALNLSKFAYLADDAGSRDRIGTVLRLIRDDMETLPPNEAEGVFAKYVPVGGLGTWLANKMGVPTWVASAKADLLMDAAGKLRPSPDFENRN